MRRINSFDLDTDESVLFTAHFETAQEHCKTEIWGNNNELIRDAFRAEQNSDKTELWSDSCDNLFLVTLSYIVSFCLLVFLFNGAQD